MPPTNTLIILGVICIAIGFVAGALIALLFADRDKKTSGVDSDSLPEGISRETHKPLLRLWRVSNGTLVVELGGRVLTNVKQASAAQRLELEAANELWLNWLGMPEEALRTAALIQPQPEPQPKPAARSESVLPQPLAERRQAPDLVAAIAKPSIEAPVVGPKSMIEQIDEILQELVIHSAQSHRSVKVTQDLRDGIVVWLDGGRYPGLDSVPDAEIRTLIRAAAAEWERRSERAK